MNISLRRVKAIVRKELREYRRNRFIVMGMAVLPLVFIIQPLIVVLNLGSESRGLIAHEHVLLYLLGIPALVPTVVAASAVAGERAQGTLEPALTTPIRSEEYLLGKALAALIPSLVVAYLVYALFLGLVVLFAAPGIATALLQGPDLLAQLIFTPLLAAWSIWVSMALSTRSSDVRVAQQLSTLASLPTALVAVLIAVNLIPPTMNLALGAAALLIALDVAGWRITSGLFNRERLVSGPS
jgi:ABC-2 type transport system permease protein